MPPIQPPDLVLVTGASGFLGTHFVAALTNYGFRVRGAVRTQQQGEYIKDRWGAEYAVVPDMTHRDAYDVAVVGARAVIHASSQPDVGCTGDAGLVIDPAVAGVQNLLDAIVRRGEAVRRVVQISSAAAVTLDNTGVHTEEEWNDAVVPLAHKEDAAPPLKYHASKVVSERAFWDFFATPRAFDGIALLPGYVFGTPTEYDTTLGKVSGSPAVLIPWLTMRMEEAALREPFYPGVDVRDVNEAALKVLTGDVAGRYLVSGPQLVGNDFAVAAGQLRDDKLLPGITDPAKRAALVQDAGGVDSRRAREELGIMFRDKDEMLAECARGVWDVIHPKA